MEYFHPTKGRFQKECKSRAIGALVAAYIVDLLEEPEAEDVEDHLLDCLRCKERYLTILDIRGSARRARANRLARGASS